MRKITLSMAALALSAGLVFTGCSGKTSAQTDKQETQTTAESQTTPESSSAEAGTEKAVEPMTVGFGTKVYENDQFSMEVPESWTVDDKSNPNVIVQVYDPAKATREFVQSIVLTLPDNVPDDMETLKKELEKSLASQADYGLNILASEVMDRSFGQVFYVQLATVLTDEILDRCIEENMISSAQIDQAGGRENMIEMMNKNSTQIQIYVKKEGLPCIAIASTYDDASFEEIKEVALYIAETLKAK